VHAESVLTETSTNWRPIATGCRAVRARADTLSARIVARIEHEIAPYEQALLTERDHREVVQKHMHMVLGGVAERRSPGEPELEFARKLGRLRARQGLPLYALIQAYHVGYQELWEELCTEVNARPGSDNAALPYAAGDAWEWVHAISSAVAEAHEDAAHAPQNAELKVARRFVDLLTLSDAPVEELFDVARSLGFDPDGTFQALSVMATDLTPRQIERIGTALGLVGTARCLAVEGDQLLILWQRACASDVRAILERLAPDRPVGVGLERKALSGAAISIGDAERALAIATRRGVDADFAREWLASAMLQSEDRLVAILEPGLTAADEQPHLLEAVIGFAEANFSVAAMARALYLHPNTATYRLERWRTVTGWNPRSFDGLMKSLACALLRRQEVR
jgi:hypothetical protein